MISLLGNPPSEIIEDDIEFLVQRVTDLEKKLAKERSKKNVKKETKQRRTSNRKTYIIVKIYKIVKLQRGYRIRIGYRNSFKEKLRYKNLKVGEVCITKLAAVLVKFIDHYNERSIIEFSNIKKFESKKIELPFDKEYVVLAKF